MLKLLSIWAIKQLIVKISESNCLDCMYSISKHDNVQIIFKKIRRERNKNTRIINDKREKNDRNKHKDRTSRQREK